MSSRGDGAPTSPPTRRPCLLQGRRRRSIRPATMTMNVLERVQRAIDRLQHRPRPAYGRIGPTRSADDCPTVGAASSSPNAGGGSPSEQCPSTSSSAASTPTGRRSSVAERTATNSSSSCSDCRIQHQQHHQTLPVRRCRRRRRSSATTAGGRVTSYCDNDVEFDEEEDDDGGDDIERTDHRVDFPSTERLVVAVTSSSSPARVSLPSLHRRPRCNDPVDDEDDAFGCDDDVCDASTTKNCAWSTASQSSALSTAARLQRTTATSGDVSSLSSSLWASAASSSSTNHCTYGSSSSASPSRRRFQFGPVADWRQAPSRAAASDDVSLPTSFYSGTGGRSGSGECSSDAPSQCTAAPFRGLRSPVAVRRRSGSAVLDGVDASAAAPSSSSSWWRRTVDGCPPPTSPASCPGSPRVVDCCVVRSPSPLLSSTGRIRGGAATAAPIQLRDVVQRCRRGPCAVGTSAAGSPSPERTAGWRGVRGAPSTRRSAAASFPSDGGSNSSSSSQKSW